MKPFTRTQDYIKAQDGTHVQLFDTAKPAAIQDLKDRGQQETYARMEGEDALNRAVETAATYGSNAVVVIGSRIQLGTADDPRAAEVWVPIRKPEKEPEVTMDLKHSLAPTPFLEATMAAKCAYRAKLINYDEARALIRDAYARANNLSQAQVWDLLP